MITIYQKLVLEGQNQTVIRSSVDFFHNPRDVRYRLDANSPRGFYTDSYNYFLLKEVLLNPLGPGGSRRYRVAAFDHKTNSSVDAPEQIAQPGSILVFDGIFLHWPELRHYWDFSIFLEVGFGISVPRGNQRFGGSPDPSDESNRRYVQGQKIYLSKCKPQRWATLVVNNENLEAPTIKERGKRKERRGK